jgi:hypothetical protein
MSTYKILSRKQGQYQFQRGMPLKRKERNMVKFSFDPSNLTELTAQQKARRPPIFSSTWLHTYSLGAQTISPSIDMML